MRTPNRFVACPAVNKNQRGVAFAVIRVMNLEMINIDKFRFAHHRLRDDPARTADEEQNRDQFIHAPTLFIWKL